MYVGSLWFLFIVEIGSLPEKEFRIMIVKMIQNLENKMELQIII